MSQPESNKLSRRILFAGAGTAGAVAAVASLIPAAHKTQALPVQPKAAPAKGGGYSLTDHVKRYYKTTLV
ncbi:formate dehydrogenase [Polaromonas sp. C04]|uniref:formate dehydrogenase n=1 Tax=Polaromonas sp. C04 TaxID=1945857 RepID=UPI000984A571|nr:formate dehydrogenase [Polaromonas sp. C04]OOG58651.1 formate dehydrogenase [Polaromonas sp. C04]